MERSLDLAATELSALLLATAVALIGASLVGLGATAALAVVFAGLAGLLVAFRERVAVPVGGDERVARLLGDSWVAPAAAAATVIAALGAEAGEVQTLGGLIGLAGVSNYLLRPVYRWTYRLLAWARGDGGGRGQGDSRL